MFLRRTFFFTGLIVICIIQAQDVGVRNWLEYRGAWEGHSYFQDRLLMRIDWSKFAAGLQYLAQEPSKVFSNKDSAIISSKIESYWFSFYTQNLELVAGSFTAVLGHGILLDLYQRYDLNIDHHCDGAFLKLRIPYIEVTGFNGIAKWDNRAIVRGGQLVFTPWNFMLGQEYAKIKPSDSLSQDMFGAFASGDLSWISFWVEAGYKQSENPDIPKGTAYYTSSSILLYTFSITGEYKNYSDFGMGKAQYCNPPTLYRYPPYILTSMRMKGVDLDDEIGYSAALSGKISSIAGELFYSHSSNHDKEYPIDQIWVEIERQGYNFLGKLGIEYLKDKDSTFMTGIVDATFKPALSPISFTAIAEGQKVDWRKNMFFLISISYTGFGTMGIEGGVINEESMIRAFTDLDFFESVRLRIGLGKRPGGFSCSGGICRNEESFEGVEVDVVVTY
jgi:hypothetical protein